MFSHFDFRFVKIATVSVLQGNWGNFVPLAASVVKETFEIGVIVLETAEAVVVVVERGIAVVVAQ